MTKLSPAYSSTGTRFGNEISYFEPGPQERDWDILLGDPVESPSKEIELRRPYNRYKVW
jgi:hypothetical protein